jgi:two-component system, cell cycle sensor histidine kinase and response regulator CckA
MESSPVGHTTKPNKETILLVDDQEGERRLMRSALTKEGYQVLECNSGESAWLRFQEQTSKIDLVLTDILMPGLDGVGLAERVLDMAPSVKVLFISGYERKFEHKILGQKVEVVAKSFDLTNLLQKIREIFNPPQSLGQWIKKQTGMILTPKKAAA